MSTKKPQPPPPLPDQRLTEFLQSAAVILSSERGINAKSRMKLTALGQRLGLSQQELERAVLSLQAGAPPVGDPTDRVRKALRAYVGKRLAALPHGILTSKIEQALVAKAAGRFQLDPTSVCDAVREEAAERKVRRISAAESERHVEEMVAQKVGDSIGIDVESAARLRASGREWGLTNAQVDTIIDAYTAENLRRRRRERMTTTAALTSAVLAIALLLAIGAAIVLMRSRSTGNTATNDPPEQRPAPALVAPTPTVKPPGWWNADLVVSLYKARSDVAGFAPLWESLASSDDAGRADAYAQLVEVSRKIDQPDQRKILSQVIAGFYVLDPSDDCALRLGEALVGVVPADNAPPPPSPTAYHQAFWATETALALLANADLPEARAAALAERLGRKLGVSVAVGDAALGSEARQRCLAALSKLLYRQLIAGAAGIEPRVLSLQKTLSALARPYIDLEVRDRLETDLLVAVLPAAGRAWQPYDDWIKDCIFSQNPFNVLRVLELYERSDQPDLQDRLAELLLLRVRATPRSMAVADVAQAIRQALGVKPPPVVVTVRDRWEKLRAKAATVSRPAATKTTDELLQEITDVAHLATAACAVAQQEPGYALFDRLWEQGPPRLDAPLEEGDEEPGFPPDVRDRRVPPLTDVQKRDLVRWTRSLGNYDRLPSVQRTSFLRGLAQLTDRIADIEPDQAAAIAKYLLAPKTEREHDSIIEPAARVGRWPHVRLAVADQLEDSTLPVAITQSLLGALLRAEVELGERRDWVPAMRRRLLRDVLVDLTPADAAGEPGDSYSQADRAAAALKQLYDTRASLLGVAPATYRAAASPADTMELLVQQTAVSLRVGGGASGDAADLVARLPHELAAARYLGNSDPRRLVPLQRLWLRLLALETDRRRPERATETRQLVDALAERDARADDLLMQIWDGEETTWKMWMLYASSE